MGDTATKVRVCSVCGVDCSKMERFKDAATGLYTCGACEKKRAAAIPSAVAAVPATEPVDSGPIPLADEPAWLADFKAPEVRKCVKCQALLSPGQEGCVSCGYDPRPVVRNVKVVKKVQKKPKIEEEEWRKTRGEGGSWGGIIAAVVILVVIVGILYQTTGRNAGVGVGGVAVAGLLLRIGLRVWLYSSRDD